MTDPTNPKIVDGTIPEFGQSTTKPDTLDAIVTPQTATTADGSMPVCSDYLTRMRHLAEMITPLLSTVHYDGKWQAFPLDPKSEPAFFFANFARLGFKQNSSIPTITFPNPQTPQLKQFLESSYGPDIAQSGIYEVLGLDQKQEVSIYEISAFFSELSKLQTIDDKPIKIKDNPYQRVLTLPLEVRHFFSGALEYSKPQIDNQKILETFAWDLTTRQILEYAKQSGELAQVGQYLKTLQENPL